MVVGDGWCTTGCRDAVEHDIQIRQHKAVTTAHQPWPAVSRQAVEFG